MRVTITILTMMLLTSTAAGAEKVDWKTAASHRDRIVTMEGTVASAKCSKTACHLNFHSSPQDKSKFSSIIYVFDLDEFPPDPDVYFQGKQIRVTGTVRIQDGVPVIVLKKRGSVEIVRTDEK